MFNKAKTRQEGLQISYYVHGSGNMYVTLQCLEQELCIRPAKFKKILGISYDVECGCREISVIQAVDMGFVFPQAKTDNERQKVV